MEAKHLEAFNELVEWCKKYEVEIVSQDNMPTFYFRTRKGGLVAYFARMIFSENTKRVSQFADVAISGVYPTTPTPGDTK